MNKIIASIFGLTSIWSAGILLAIGFSFPIALFGFLVKRFFDLFMRAFP